MEIKNHETGILLIAQGKQRYFNMAVNLVKSLRLNHGLLPVALVTDHPVSEKEKQLFDHIIPIDPAYGTGFSQKMRMYGYSPFSQTLFIDVDCLVVNSLSEILEGLSKQDVCVLGTKKFQGPLVGTTVEKLRLVYPQIDGLPVFNGGVYYFKKNERAKAIFDFALHIFHDRYNELGLHLFNGKPGDEPVMTIALAHYACEPFDDNGKGMYTPVGQSGIFRMDILKKYCSFVKHGKTVEPVIMHFGGGYPEAFHYRREMAKINLYLATRLPRPVCSFLVNLAWNTAYGTYVFGYRVTKSIIKRKPFRFRPILPMFRFE
jgi:hypothetical protein